MKLGKLGWLVRTRSLIAVALLAATVAACGPAHPRADVFRNWSGMAALGGKYTTVSAAWTQPAIKFAPGSRWTNYDCWVGFGGIGSIATPSEQIGTRCSFNRGKISYSAWYDMNPKPNVPIKMVVGAGDLMAASVTSRGQGVFVLTLRDRTTGRTFTTVQTDAAVKCDSAEIIAQWPIRDQSFGSPASGVVHFTQCLVNGRPVGHFDPMTIYLDSNGVNGMTSALGRDGASFSIALRPS